MSNAMTTPEWSVDLTMVCELYAERLHREGVENPVAAAIARTARGHLGVDQATAAEKLKIPVEAIADAEAGQTSFGDLPDEVTNVVAARIGDGMLRLAALDSAISGQ